MNDAGSAPPAGRTTVSITSDPARMAGVREIVQQVAEQVGFVDPDLAWVVLAVDEAITNVICHGYQGRAGQPIEITLEPVQHGGDPGLQVVICDCGRQVDPATIAGRDLDDIRPGGLGTHIIRSIMDEVEYTHRRPAGMQLRMLKILRPRTESGTECRGTAAEKE